MLRRTPSYVIQRIYLYLRLIYLYLSMKLLKTIPQYIAGILSSKQGHLYTSVTEENEEWFVVVKDLELQKLFKSENSLHHIGTTSSGELLFQNAEALMHRKPEINWITLFDPVSGVFGERKPANLVVYNTSKESKAYQSIRKHDEGETFVAFDPLSFVEQWEHDYKYTVRCAYDDAERFILIQSNKRQDLAIRYLIATGEARWMTKIKDLMTHNKEETRAQVTRLIPKHNLVLFYIPDSHFFALNISTGEKVWEQQLALTAPYSCLVDDDGSIYLTKTEWDRERRIHMPIFIVMDGKNGEVLLQKNLETEILEEEDDGGWYSLSLKAVNDHHVYFVSQQLGGVYKLDKRNGNMLERHLHHASFYMDPIVQGNHLFALEENDEGKRLVIFEL